MNYLMEDLQFSAILSVIIVIVFNADYFTYVIDTIKSVKDYMQ